MKLRTHAKGAGSKDAALAMTYKLVDAAQARWRVFNGAELVEELLDGATFKDGVKVTNDETTRRTRGSPPNDPSPSHPQLLTIAHPDAGLAARVSSSRRSGQLKSDESRPRYGAPGRGYDRLVRLPTQDDATLYLRLHALEDTGAQAEARVVLSGLRRDELRAAPGGLPAGSRERHLLAEFLGFYEGAGVIVSRGLWHEDVSPEDEGVLLAYAAADLNAKARGGAAHPRRHRAPSPQSHRREDRLRPAPPVGRHRHADRRQADRLQLPMKRSPAAQRPPADGQGEVRLADDSRMTIRPIEPGDKSLLAYLNELDQHDHDALLAIDLRSGCYAGVARFLRVAEEVADPAMVLVDRWPRFGLGTASRKRPSVRVRRGSRASRRPSWPRTGTRSCCSSGSAPPRVASWGANSAMWCCPTAAAPVRPYASCFARPPPASSLRREP